MRYLYIFIFISSSWKGSSPQELKLIKLCPLAGKPGLPIFNESYSITLFFSIIICINIFMKLACRAHSFWWIDERSHPTIVGVQWRTTFRICYLALIQNGKLLKMKPASFQITPIWRRWYLSHSYLAGKERHKLSYREAGPWQGYLSF